MRKLYSILSLLLFVCMPLTGYAATNSCTTSNLNLTCPAGEILQGIAGDGSKVCVPLPGSSSGPSYVLGFSRCVNVTVRPASANPFSNEDRYTVTMSAPATGTLLSSAPLLGVQADDFIVLGPSVMPGETAVRGINGWIITECGAAMQSGPTNLVVLPQYIEQNHCVVKQTRGLPLRDIDVVACHIGGG